MAAEGSVKTMGVFALGLVSLAVISLIGIAVLTQFKVTDLVDNTTADNFIAGLALFGSFSTLIAIVLIGKIVIGMFKGGKY